MADNAWSYFLGQCTYWAAKIASWIPAGLGNADTWVANAKAKGFSISPIPVKGSVVQYAAGPDYSSFGHVAVVTAVDPGGSGFTVSEMNYKGVGVVDTRHSSMADVVGFILPPGTAVPQQGVGVAGAASPGEFEQILSMLGLNANDALIRAGLILAGMLLILVGLLVAFNRQIKDTAMGAAEGAVAGPEGAVAGAGTGAVASVA